MKKLKFSECTQRTLKDEIHGDISVYLFTKDTDFLGLPIKRGSLLLKRAFRGETNFTICMDFPLNYKGKNPLLNVWWLDDTTNTWLLEPEKNNETKWLMWCYRRLQKTPYYMRHENRSKYEMDGSFRIVTHKGSGYKPQGYSHTHDTMYHATGTSGIL